jgi:N-formylglutamate amidohydrolase
MPAMSGRISEEGPGKPRADFVLGDRDGTTCSAEFTDLVAGILRKMGYDVKVNDPYKGVELVRAFSDPKAERHSLQIEANRRLYMDEKSRERTSSFGSLKANLDRMLEEVAKYAAERSHDCRGHDHHHHDHDHGHHHHDHDHDHDHHDHGHDHSNPHRH